ncbi:MAG: hypothetical protein M3N48_12505 [Verrucomicrobiota bacterium]|nr:hypothetical protein [Verrucomicrobiota bacterium]
MAAAINFAFVYVALGEKEEALNWLEKGYDDRSIENGFKVEPFLEPLHDEPRFERPVACLFPDTKSAPPLHPRAWKRRPRCVSNPTTGRASASSE